MKKTIIAIAAAGILGGAATTLTPAPAHAVFPIFLAAVKPDPNFKSVNPYDKKVVKKSKAKKSKKAKAKKS